MMSLSDQVERIACSFARVQGAKVTKPIVSMSRMLTFPIRRPATSIANIVPMPDGDVIRPVVATG